jgi:osmoprotectant transport system permease protein
VGAPSLGNYIFGGLQTRNSVAVLVGCVAAAALAQLLDRLVDRVEKGLRARRRAQVLVPGAILVLLYAYSGLSFAAASLHGRQAAPVRIGAKAFTEQYVLSELLASAIRGGTSRRAEVIQSLGSTVAFDALRASDIDLYVDYSGTIWATVMEHTDMPHDRATLLDEVRRFLAEEHGVVVVATLGFENTYALAMPEARARELGVERLSDLAPHAPALAVGGDFELFHRNEWQSVLRTYGLAFREQRVMDPSLMYEAARTGAVDLVAAYSTDGRIDAYDLTVLEDDRSAIPPYDAIVLASPRLVRDAPDVVDALRDLEGLISAGAMRRANAAVDQGGQSPAVAAQALLREVRRGGSGRRRDGPSGPARVQ